MCFGEYASRPSAGRFAELFLDFLEQRFNGFGAFAEQFLSLLAVEHQGWGAGFLQTVEHHFAVESLRQTLGDIVENFRRCALDGGDAAQVGAGVIDVETRFLEGRHLRQEILADIVRGPIAPLGLYSRKFKSVAEVKEGARIAVPNDPTNLARTFVFLEQFGLVKAKAGVDPLKVTEKDLAENPKKLKFVPLEAAQLPHALDDTDFSVINGNFAISSGLKLAEAVVLEKTPDYYLLVAAVRTPDKNTPWAADIAAAFKTKFFKDVLDKHFPGYARPAALQ